MFKEDPSVVGTPKFGEMKEGIWLWSTTYYIKMNSMPVFWAHQFKRLQKFVKNAP